MATKVFNLKIEMGNDLMKTRKHVSSSLKKISDRVAGGETQGIIMDGNGNTVGKWEFTKE